MKNIKITDVRAIEGDSAFLLDDGETAIMYDAGFAFTGHRVAENIRSVLKDRSLDYIFLTHSHYDHALGSAYVKKMYPDCKVVAGEHAAEIFKKSSAKKVMRELDGKFARECGVEEYEDLIDELSVDIAVKDGDSIKAGNMNFTAVALPGHTRCSFGYYLEENKLLLGTETIGVYGGDGIVCPSYLIGYNPTMKSIEKVEKMDIESILVPHYGLLAGDEAKEYIRLGRKNAEETAEELARILRSGGTEEDAYSFFAEKYYHGYIKIIYPIAALELNTSIMVKLIQSELVGEQ